MKIAIVGAGVTGLTAAYALSKEHDITLFESEPRLGGHAHTVRVDGGDGEYWVDTGFLVYNEATYPHFIELLKQLDVPTKPTVMSFSYQNASLPLEWKGTNLNTVFAQRSNLLRPRFWRMVLDILSFNRYLRDILKEPPRENFTLAELLEKKSWSKEFREWYLIPMGAAIWSANPEKFTDMPARSFAEFFSRHGLLQVKNMPKWRTIDGGSRLYVEKIREVLLARGSQIRHAAVTSVERTDQVVVTTNEGAEVFDHVVMACHSTEALAVLKDPTALETEVLGAIAYQDNEVTLHYDESLLPKRRLAWAAWNYRDDASGSSRATLTYNISTLQSIEAPRQFLVSLNSNELIDQEKILRTFSYAHPVLDSTTVRAQAKRLEINTKQTSFCGAYFGFGFHEDGARSALEVCANFGVTL